MGHCSSDPELEVLLNPLSFSLFFGRFTPLLLTVYALFYFGGFLLGCIVRVWWQRGLQGCLDTDWIHSFIIRQIGWSRCEMCKSRSGSCSEPNPFLPHPTGKSTREGYVFLMQWGKKRLPHPSSFSLYDSHSGAGVLSLKTDTRGI